MSDNKQSNKAAEDVGVDVAAGVVAGVTVEAAKSTGLVQEVAKSAYTHVTGNKIEHEDHHKIGLLHTRVDDLHDKLDRLINHLHHTPDEVRELHGKVDGLTNDVKKLATPGNVAKAEEIGEDTAKAGEHA
jgi:outer membrane murein-binding lipoprotein Lpp